MKRLAITAALMCGAALCLSSAAGAQPAPPTAAATANVPLAAKIGHYDPSKTRPLKAVHDGAGTMNFGPIMGANGLSTNLLFLHRGVIHPHSGIGQHFHNHCEEMFIIFDDTAQFTVNGRTSQLTGTWGVPDRMGSAHGIYNPTDHDIEWMNINVGVSKTYDAFNLGDDRVGAPLDKVPQFVTMHLDRALLKPMTGAPGVSRRRALGPSVFYTPWAFVDHLLIQLYVKGECAYNADGGVAKGVAGDIVCFDLSRPMKSQATDMDIVSLILPRSMIRLTPRVIDDLHGARVDGASTLGVLLGEHMRTMARIAPQLAGPDGKLAAEVASAIVSSGFSAAVAAEREALMDLNIQTIQIFIERHLTNPSLSADMIMRHFALSRSALYRLFEPIGGIAEYVRERRLKLAYLKLTSVGTSRGSVAKLAYATGFASENAFSRAFQQRFGLRPSEAIRNADAGIRLKSDLGAGDDNWMQDWLDRLRATA